MSLQHRQVTNTKDAEHDHSRSEAEWQERKYHLGDLTMS
jgi:hypothetical protein